MVMISSSPIGPDSIAGIQPSPDTETTRPQPQGEIALTPTGLRYKWQPNNNTTYTLLIYPPRYGSPQLIAFGTRPVDSSIPTPTEACEALPWKCLKNVVDLTPDQIKQALEEILVSLKRKLAEPHQHTENEIEEFKKYKEQVEKLIQDL